MRAVRDSESSIRTDLELTKQKYKESLAEINDLNSQLTELKLNGGVPSSTEPDPFQLDKDAGEDEQLEKMSEAEDLHDTLSKKVKDSVSRAVNLSAS